MTVYQVCSQRLHDPKGKDSPFESVTSSVHNNQRWTALNLNNVYFIQVDLYIILVN